jgi:oxygen-independent coproporphyrinogen-3 oxidase
LSDRFVLNTANFDEYYASIEAGHLPVNRGLVRSKEDLVRWAVVLPLKNRTIRKRDFERVAGLPLESVFREKFKVLKQAGLIADTKWGLALTTLGCFFADEVVQQFFEPCHLPFPTMEYVDGPLHPLHNSEIFDQTALAAAE